MKKIFFAAFIVCVLCVQSVFGGNMEVFTLSNNIKVLFYKTDGAEVATIRVFTPVAAIADDIKKAGLACIASRLMTRSTLNRSNEVLANDIEDIGADISAECEYDLLNINSSFMSKHFDRAVEILADVIINPAFKEDELASEKKDTVAALISRKDNINAVASDAFIAEFYSGTPYALPVAGSTETVNTITTQDLRDWHKNAFNASNITISVAGNIKPAVVRAALEKYFSKIPAGQKFEKPAFNIKSPAQKVKRIKTKFNQAYIYKGYRAPSVYDKDFVNIKVAGAVLGGKMSSRLFVELREKLGLAYEVNAVYPTRVEDSFFVIYMGLDKNNIDSSLQKIDELLADFKNKEVGDKELKDTKTYVKGLYALDRQTTGKLSYYYGMREVMGQGYKYDDTYIEDFQKVTAGDVRSAADRVFNNESFTIILDPSK